MKKRKILLFIAKCALIAGWSGVLAIYVAVSKEILPLFIAGIVAAAAGLISAPILYLVASFPDKALKREWISYLTVEKEDGPTDFTAALEKTRLNYSNDGDPQKNTFLKPLYSNAKPLCDFTALNTGKIYYGCLVMANENLFKYSRFVNKVLPAVVIYSKDEYLNANPEELLKIAEKLETSNEGPLKNQTKFFTEMKLSEELAGDREIFMATILICKRQLPLGKFFSYRLFPVIAAPQTSLPAFAVDCKYWADELIYDFIRYEYGEAPYGEPFDI